MKNQIDKTIQWSENVILADAAYIDKVAFNLIVNFERMIMRQIPPADMARWIDCVVLDGGVREGEHDTQVLLVHPKEKLSMDNFLPARLADELNGKAFKDHLGEFSITTLPVERMVEAEDFFLDILGTVCAQKEVRRVMVIPNAEEGTLYDDIRETLRRLADDDDKRITVFTMEPKQGGNFRQEILGYSLMNALGIRAEELER